MITIKNWLRYAYMKLIKSKINFYKNEPYILLEYITNIKFEDYIIYNNKKMKYKIFLILENLLNMRSKNIPISFIIKNKEFYSLPFIINKNLFIPRNETESLIDFLYNKYNNKFKYNIIDLGTGVGNISIVLAKIFTNSCVTGIDINKHSIYIAKLNAEKLCVKNVNFFISNWFSNIKNKNNNIIISNPPYISNTEYKIISSHKSIYEPKLSLVSKENGLFDIKHIIKYAKNYLLKNGILIIEHGLLQGLKIRKIMHEYNYKYINTYLDENKHERFTVCKK